MPLNKYIYYIVIYSIIYNAVFNVVSTSVWRFNVKIYLWLQILMFNLSWLIS